MIDDFDKLRALGAQKIHEATHISRSHVQSVLHGDFDGMTKIQLLGFISIFEREYHMDLSGLRQRALDYFDDTENDPTIASKQTHVFQNPKNKTKLSIIYLSIAIAIFVAFMLVDTDSTKEEDKHVITIDNSAIESAKSNIITTKEELVENNVTQAVTPIKQEVEVKEEKSDDVVSFKIIPKVKVWLGYVDLSTHKKYQKTFEKELVLDPLKNWLLAFGHGHIDVEINGVVKKYTIKKNVRFSYIDGELKEVGLEEFKRLNKGSRW